VPLAPTLGLTMMVKNEADFIVQTLNSTKPFIDHWTIVDTGGSIVSAGKSACRQTAHHKSGTAYHECGRQEPIADTS
jgi:hypothetical protein